MSDELTRLLTILNNGSDQAVLDNASDIAALIRQLQRENERATRLLAAVEGLGRKIQADNDSDADGATVLELFYADGAFTARITWHHHDGPIDEASRDDTDAVQALIALSREALNG